jgi:HK97 family phage major capsid protein
MTDITEVKKLIDDAGNAVSQLRQSQEQAVAEFKKHGDVLAETKSKQDAIQNDITGLIQAIQEVKAAQSAQIQTGSDGLTKEVREAKSALFKKMRGMQLSDTEQKALSTITNPDGGYLTTSDTTGRIIQRIHDNSPVRRFANVKTTGKETVTGLIDNGRNSYSWGFQGNTPSTTATKQFGQYEIKVKKLYAKPTATTEMLEDADYDIEAMIVNDAAQGFAEGEAYGFLLGNGVLQPRGMMTVATAYTGDNTRAWGTVQKFKTGVNGGFAATPNGGKILIDAAMSLRGAYRAGAIWGMNRFTFAEAMKLQDSDGNFIWQPTWNLTDSPFGMILGIPVVPDFDHMADIANDSLSIFVGDLNQAYQIVDRRGVNVIRDNITNPDVVQWYFTKRTGGDLVNSEAVRFVEFKA